jgi:putative DNA primase/helicase
MYSENEKPAVGANGLINTDIPNSNILTPQKQSEYEQEFIQAMGAAGVVCIEPIIADGQIQRFATNGRGKKDGWYVFFGMAGAYGHWSQGINEKWSVSRTGLSKEEQTQLKRQIEASRKAQAEETQRKHAEAAQQAHTEWTSLQEEGHSAYLDRKQVEAFGIRYGDKYIAVPIMDIEGKLWSLQKIYPDGNKRFLPGGRKKGCFHLIGEIEPDKPIYVVEGYATGASVHMATDLPVVIAFDAGNLGPVVESIRNTHPSLQIIIAADNDQWKGVNTGKEAAEGIAGQYGCKVGLPIFNTKDLSEENKPTDFNDLHVLEGLEAVKVQLKLADAPSDEWPDLQPIKAELLPVSPLPIEMIPEPLQAWVKDVAIRMQCPIDHIAIPAIIMIGSVVGAGCAIRPKRNDDWQVIPNLWGGIVGKPGTLKSPALSAVLHPLKGLAQKAMEDFKAKQKEYDCDRELHKCQKDSILSEAKRGSKASSTSMDLQTTKQKLITLEEPLEPHCRRFEVNDPTIEKMGELLSQNTRGLLLFRDELIGLLAAWDKEGHEADRAFYLESWNGCGSYTTDRIGRGTVYCQNMCVSVLGGTQPSKLRGYLHRAIGGIENDGLIQRFQMLIYPDERGKWELTDQKPDIIAQKRAYGIVEKLADMDFCLHGAAKQDEKGIPYFHFGDAAQEMFYEWLTDLQIKLSNTEDPEIIIEHLSKYRKLMPALALIFHLIDMADGKTTGPVTLESAEKAAAWCGYLESHARRIYNLGLNKRVQGAKAFSKKLKKKEVSNPFSARDVYRKEWSYLSKVEDVQNACEELIELGWLREETISPSKGQKGKTQYHINPKVWGDDE